VIVRIINYLFGKILDRIEQAIEEVNNDATLC